MEVIYLSTRTLPQVQTKQQNDYQSICYQPHVTGWLIHWRDYNNGPVVRTLTRTQTVYQHYKNVYYTLSANNFGGRD